MCTGLLCFQSNCEVEAERSAQTHKQFSASPYTHRTSSLIIANHTRDYLTNIQFDKSNSMCVGLFIFPRMRKDSVWGIHRHSNRHTPQGSASCVQSFDDSLIVQFALRIAFRCVLHRCRNLDIRCWNCLVIDIFQSCLTTDFDEVLLVIRFIFRYFCRKRLHRIRSILDKRFVIGITKRTKSTTVARFLFAIFWFWYYGNDPSAGSPTETLLRLHLPLNDEV